jgi:MFS family permease
VIVLAALRLRDFRLLWVARLLSNLGTWLLVIAVPAYVLDLTGSVLATGVAFVAETLPTLLFGPIAGVFADRWPRRRTMIAVELVRACCVLSLLLVDGVGTLWLLYLAVFVENAAGQLFIPSRQALIPALLGRGARLAAANAADGLSDGVVRLVGSTVGGLLYATTGIGGIVLADVASYLISAVAIALVRGGTAAEPEATATSVPEAAAPEAAAPLGPEVAVTPLPPEAAVTPTTPEAPAAGGGRTPGRPDATGGGSGSDPPATTGVLGVLADLRAGARHLMLDRVLRVLLLVSAMFFIANGVLNALVLPFVRAGLQGGARELGYLFSALGIGYLLGAPLGARLLYRIPLRALVTATLTALGGCFLVLFNASRIGPALVAIALVGVAGSSFIVCVQTVTQRRTPDALLGRVSASFGTAQTGAMVAGSASGALLGQYAGLPFTLNTASVFVLAVALLAALALPGSGSRR